MAEIIAQFEEVVTAPNGRSYIPRACGRLMDDGRRWEGWLEFVPPDASPVLRTSRETVQPNRDDLEYWTTGLSTAYFEGALERALEHAPVAPDSGVPAKPAFAGPAPEVSHPPSGTQRPATLAAVLDPFHVNAQGDDILRQELTALAPVHLRNIIRKYQLASEDELDLDHMSHNALAELIEAAVRAKAHGG